MSIMAQAQAKPNRGRNYEKNVIRVSTIFWFVSHIN
jgi:hypothetical protein